MPTAEPDARIPGGTLLAVVPAVTRAELGIESPATRPAASRGAPADDQREFGFQPGLEGLRGLAVMAVLVFHGGFSWAGGGFLGVSTFFTLSGFLITTLLIAEHRKGGSIDLKRFWGRRFRRLMPAAMVCLAGVLVFAATIATPGQLMNLRDDMVASLLYVANWRFIADGASYAELFQAPSPVLHFWSLAIEEQFYLLFPLVAAGLLALGRGSRRLFAGALVVATAASIWYSFVVAGRSIDAAYYNTFTRASELLIGSLLALAVAHPGVRRWLKSRPARSVIALASVAALALCGWAWYAARQTDLWLYRGGLPLYALLTATVIVGVVEPGPLKTAFSNPTLRWLGRISYGVYLYHWPIFLWLTPARTGLSEWPLFLLRMAVTLAAAEISYRLIEQPVRKGRWITGWHSFVIVPLAVTLMLLGIVRVTADLPTGQLISLEQVAAPEIPDFVAAEALDVPVPIPPPVDLSVYEIPPPPPPVDPPALRAGERPRIFFTGDSAAFSLAAPMAVITAADGTVDVHNGGRFGCGVGRGGMIRFEGAVRATGVACNDFGWLGRLKEVRPHMVLLVTGIWDVADRFLVGDDQWRSFGDPLYDQFFRRELTLTVDALASQGAKVVLLTHPQVRSGIIKQLLGPFPEEDPARMRRLNQILVEVAATRPGVVVFDLAGHMAARPNGEIDLGERPDGIHWSVDGARTLLDWLTPQLLALLAGEPTDPGTILWPLAPPPDPVVEAVPVATAQ